MSGVINILELNSTFVVRDIGYFRIDMEDFTDPNLAIEHHITRLILIKGYTNEVDPSSSVMPDRIRRQNFQSWNYASALKSAIESKLNTGGTIYSQFNAEGIVITKLSALGIWVVAENVITIANKPLKTYTIDNVTSLPTFKAAVDIGFINGVQFSKVFNTRSESEAAYVTTLSELKSAPASNGLVGSSNSGTGGSTAAIFLRSIENLAALRQLIPPTGIGAVIVAGHTTPKDGGGDLFYWKSDATEADDNGCIISTGATVGRWIREHEGIITLQMYGGDTTGNTNIVPVLTNAFANQSAIVLTPGDYLVSDNYSVPVNKSLYLQEGAVIHTASGKIFDVAGTIYFSNWSQLTGAGSYSGSNASYVLLGHLNSVLTIADDTAVNILYPRVSCINLFLCKSADTTFYATIVADFVTPGATKINGHADITVTSDTVLAGTTGADDKFNVSVDNDGKLYLENRTGSSVTLMVTPGAYTGLVETASAGQISYVNDVGLSFNLQTFLNNYLGMTAEGAALPTPTADMRGGFITKRGLSGANDELYWCRRKSDDTYEFVLVA